jgi:predicted YcjX-like family ATPase
LALLRKSYAEWSAEALALSREPLRAGIAAEWHAALAGADPAGAEDEMLAKALAEAFTRYLRAARADEHALSMLPPGRFLMPGDQEGSPALTFAPLDLAAMQSTAGATLAAMMERRYEAYKTHVVKPFFRDHFARLDRQIVLVDMLAAPERRAGGDPRPGECAGRRALRLPPRSGELAHLHRDAAHRSHPVRRHQSRPRPPFGP